MLGVISANRPSCQPIKKTIPSSLKKREGETADGVGIMSYRRNSRSSFSFSFSLFLFLSLHLILHLHLLLFLLFYLFLYLYSLFLLLLFGKASFHEICFHITFLNFTSKMNKLLPVLSVGIFPYFSRDFGLLPRRKLHFFGIRFVHIKQIAEL